MWLLLLLVFGSLAAEKTIAVLMPLAADARGASYAWVGVLSGASQFILVLLLIPGTWLVALWGRRTAVVLGIGLQGIATLAFAAVGDIYWMLLPQAVLGVGLSLFWPAYLSYFAEVAAGAAHRMQMRRSLAQGAALLVSPVIATYLAGRFGYGAGFGVIGAITTAIALVGLRLTGPNDRPAGTRQSPTALLQTYRSAGALLRRPAFALVVAVTTIGSLLIYLVAGSFLTLHLQQLGFTSLMIGMLISLRSLSDVALRTMFTRLAARMPPFYLVAFSAGGVAVINLLFPLVALPAAVVVLMVLLGMFASQYDPATVTVLSNLLRTDERDVGIAVWVTINALAAWVFAPLLGGLGDIVGLPTVFMLCACIGLAAIAALVSWGRLAAERLDAPDELVEMYR